MFTHARITRCLLMQLLDAFYTFDNLHALVTYSNLAIRNLENKCFIRKKSRGVAGRFISDGTRLRVF